MKRLLTVLVLILSLVSCNVNNAGDPFLQFKGEFSVTVNAVCEGNCSVFVYSSADKSIAFISPAELKGYVMRNDNGKAILCYGGIEVPLSAYSSHLLTVCEEVFSADVDEITSISAEETDSGTVTAVNTQSRTYRFLDDGTPLSASGTAAECTFEMKFSDFRVSLK